MVPLGPEATAVLPATPADPQPAPIPALDRPTAYEGSPPPEKKSRNVLPVVLIVLLLVAAAIAAGVLLFGQDDEEPSSSSSDDSPTRRTSQASSATSETSSSEPTTPTTTADETVTVDADDYIGRDRFEVEAELQRMGLVVRLFEDENPGGETPDTVSSLKPTGELLVGDPIDLHYWGPEVVTTPTTETTATTETTSTETGSTDATEGDNG